MKKIILTDKLLSFSIGCLFILGGCNSSIGSSNQEQIYKGNFVNIFNEDIYYHCADKVKELSDDGQFQCKSFPISFYANNVKLGEIYSIHEDGYVFPQDIIFSDERESNYAKGSMRLSKAD